MIVEGIIQDIDANMCRVHFPGLGDIVSAWITILPGISAIIGDNCIVGFAGAGMDNGFLLGSGAESDGSYSDLIAKIVSILQSAAWQDLN